MKRGSPNESSPSQCCVAVFYVFFFNDDTSRSLISALGDDVIEMRIIFIFVSGSQVPHNS